MWLLTLDPANYPSGFKGTADVWGYSGGVDEYSYKMLYMNMGHGAKIWPERIISRIQRQQHMDMAIGTRAGFPPIHSLVGETNVAGKFRVTGLALSSTISFAAAEASY